MTYYRHIVAPALARQAWSHAWSRPLITWLSALCMTAAVLALSFRDGPTGGRLAASVAVGIWLLLQLSDQRGRRKEFKTLRALGGSRHFLLDMVWAECMVSACIGIVAGMILATALFGRPSWWAGVVCSVFGIAGSIVPALWLANVAPWGATPDARR